MHASFLLNAERLNRKKSPDGGWPRFIVCHHQDAKLGMDCLCREVKSAICAVCEVEKFYFMVVFDLCCRPQHYRGAFISAEKMKSLEPLRPLRDDTHLIL